ncbi:MAG: DUF962 domain-containing protein [Planctomycetota bacterium]
MTEAASSTAPDRIETFDAFWRFYLSEHTAPGCRLLHYLGATVALVLLTRFVVLTSLVCGVCALPAAYALAWIGHFALERNRPATWRYPLWSLRAEGKMCLAALTGRLYGEFDRHGVRFRRPFA